MEDDLSQEDKISSKLNIEFVSQNHAIKKVSTDVTAIEGKTIGDIDLKKDYLTVRKNLREIMMSGADEGSGQKATSITNNSIFVGSTKDLQAVMRERYKELMDAKVIEVKTVDDGEIENDSQTR